MADVNINFMNQYYKENLSSVKILSMKKILVFIFIAFCLLPSAFCQVKITKATLQKTVEGMGGVFMNYVIEFKNKTPDQVEADSVKSMADSAKLDFNFRKSEKGYYEITFRQALVKSEKCKTCRDVNPKNSNLIEGVIIYCRRGEKKYVVKVKKFKQLADLNIP